MNEFLICAQIEERLGIDECMLHEWLQGPQVYMDLRSLELRLSGERYLTSQVDDLKYCQFLQEQGLAPC